MGDTLVEDEEDILAAAGKEGLHPQTEGDGPDPGKVGIQTLAENLVPSPKKAEPQKMTEVEVAAPDPGKVGIQTLAENLVPSPKKAELQKPTEVEVAAPDPGKVGIQTLAENLVPSPKKSELHKPTEVEVAALGFADPQEKALDHYSGYLGRHAQWAGQLQFLWPLAGFHKRGKWPLSHPPLYGTKGSFSCVVTSKNFHIYKT
jgi:hypothetical protein